MAGSTLPIWVVILVFGIAGLIAFGHCNVYVPKEERKKAEEIAITREGGAIMIRTRVNEQWYVTSSLVISFCAVVAFCAEDFMPLARHIGGGVLGILLTLVIMFVGYCIAQVFMISAATAAHIAAVTEIQRYYMKRYEVFATMEYGTRMREQDYDFDFYEGKDDSDNQN